MPDIHITVRNRIAQADGDPEIVCGNSDYTAVFDFDAEWVAYPQKTLRTVWRDTATGKLGRDDMLFDGNSAVLPPVWRTNQVLIGVYAGNIRTTTAARVPCIGCITDTAPHHDDPDDALYRQLLAYLEQIEQGGGKPENAVMIANGVLFAGVPESSMEWDADLLGSVWEQGNGNTDTGVFDPIPSPVVYPASCRIRFPEYLSIPQKSDTARSICLSAASGDTLLQYVPYFYIGTAYIKPAEVSWHAYGTLVQVPNAATAVRFMVSREDNTRIIPEDLTSCVMHFSAL